MYTLILILTILVQIDASRWAQYKHDLNGWDETRCVSGYYGLQAVSKAYIDAGEQLLDHVLPNPVIPENLKDLPNNMKQVYYSQGKMSLNYFALYQRNAKEHLQLSDYPNSVEKFILSSTKSDLAEDGVALNVPSTKALFYLERNLNSPITKPLYRIFSANGEYAASNLEGNEDDKKIIFGKTSASNFVYLDFIVNTTIITSNSWNLYNNNGFNFIESKTGCLLRVDMSNVETVICRKGMDQVKDDKDDNLDRVSFNFVPISPQTSLHVEPQWQHDRQTTASNYMAKVTYKNFQIVIGHFNEQFKHGRSFGDNWFLFSGRSGEDMTSDGLCPSYTSLDYRSGIRVQHETINDRYGLGTRSYIDAQTAEIITVPVPFERTALSLKDHWTMGLIFKEKPSAPLNPKESVGIPLNNQYAGGNAYGCHQVTCVSRKNNYKASSIFHLVDFNRKFREDEMLQATLYFDQETVFYLNTNGMPLFKKTQEYTLDVQSDTGSSYPSYFTGRALSYYSIKFKNTANHKSSHGNKLKVLKVRGRLLKYTSKHCFLYDESKKPGDNVEIHPLIVSETYDFKYHNYDHLLLSQCMYRCGKRDAYAVKRNLETYRDPNNKACLCYDKTGSRAAREQKTCTWKHGYHEFKFQHRSYTIKGDAWKLDKTPGKPFSKDEKDAHLYLNYKTLAPLQSPTITGIDGKGKNWIKIIYDAPTLENWAAPISDRQIKVGISEIGPVVGNVPICDAAVRNNQADFPQTMVTKNGFQYEGIEVMHLFKNLKAMTWYCMYTRAFAGSNRNSDWFHFATISTNPPTAPSEPKNVYITDITHESFRITWDAPTNDGGAPVTNYTIWRQQREANGCSHGLKMTYVPNKKTFDDRTMIITITNDDPKYRLYEVYITATNAGNLISSPSEKKNFQIIELSNDLQVDPNVKNSLIDTINATTKIGQKVIVPNGKYTLSQTIELKYIERIELKSQSGSAMTMIELNRTRLLYCDPNKNIYCFGRMEGFTINGNGNNNRNNDGGAIFIINLNHALILNDMKFINNKLNGNFRGGAIAIINSPGPLLISNSIFENNTVHGMDNGGGGAIGVFDLVNLQCEHVQFKNNVATKGGGGAILSSSTYEVKGKRPSLTFTLCNFTGNKAIQNQGGVMKVDESDVVVKRSIMVENVADTAGSMYFSRSTFSALESIISKNIAKTNGGAIYAGGSTLASIKSNWTENIAQAGNGGAIEAIFSVFDFSDSILENNLAFKNGGGIAASMKSLVAFTSSVIRNNEAVNNGGGIHASDSNEVNLKQTRICNCSGVTGGGIFVTLMDKVVIADTSFTDCKATGNIGGGAIYAYNTPKISSTCTLYSNNKSPNGGGGGIMWDFDKLSMSKDNVDSPVSIYRCETLTESFVQNTALYGNDVASGVYALIQSSGSTKNGISILDRTDKVFGTKVSYQTSKVNQKSGMIIGYGTDTYPTFVFLDFYANQIISNFADTLSIQISAKHVENSENTLNISTHSVQLGKLYSSPTFFDGIKAAATNGVAKFTSLKINGIPGENYEAVVSSTRINRVLTMLQIELDTCKPGEKIVDGGEPVCQQCEAGKFSNTTNALQCSKCQKGRYSESGASTCTKCIVGKYQNLEAQFECIACNVNTYAEVEGKVNCDICKPGSYSEKTGQIRCQFCAEGQFRKAGETRCEKCPQGTSTNNTNGGECKTCSNGKYSNMEGSASCKLCPKGEFSFGTGNPITSCNKCVAGKQSGKKPGAASCSDCLPGRVSIDGVKCTLCANGEYQNEQGRTVCKLCKSGKYTNTTGASSCLECAKGKYTNQEGSQYCKECLPNSIAPKSGMVNCDECPDHTWTIDKSAQISCTKCKLGEIFNPKRGCVQCRTGKYSLIAGESLSVCHNCPHGAICLGGSHLAPKPGWWMSDGRTIKEKSICISFNASNPPDRIENHPLRCGGDKYPKCTLSDTRLGEFINKCNVPQRIFKCSLQRNEPEQQICNGVTAKNRTSAMKQCLCVENECYTGKMCEKCATGYAKYGKYECRKCFGRTVTVITFLFTMLGLIIGMGVYITLMMETVGLSDTTSSGFKIIINTIQLASLGAGFPLQWPEKIMDLFSTFGFASSASDQILQLDCLLQETDMPIIYQKAIFVSLLPIFSISLCYVVMLVAYKIKKKKTAAVVHDKHKTIKDEHHDEFHQHREKHIDEKEQLIKDMQKIEKRLAYQYKYHIRKNKGERHSPEPSNQAIILMRKTMQKAHYKGINIDKCIDHFYDKKRQLIDVRHVVQMMDDWDVGLSKDDLEVIMELLNNEGEHKLKKKDVLQYNHAFEDKLILALSVIWYMEYPMLCKTAFSLLSCRSDLQHGDHVSYLRLDYNVPCYDDAHGFMFVFVVMPMLILYTVGLPLCTFLVLVRYGNIGAHSDKVRYRYGLFTDGYREDRIWWETFIAIRKGIVVAISVFLSTMGALVQAYVGILCVGIFLAIQISQKPYKIQMLNNLEAYGLGACYVTLYAGMLFYNSYLVDKPMLVATEVIVILANIAFVIYAITELIIEYALSISQDHKFLHIIIKWHAFLSKFYNFSSATNAKIKAIHSKLEKKLHMEVDELLMIKKFENKLLKKIHLKNKVVPVDATKERAKKAWDLEDSDDDYESKSSKVLTDEEKELTEHRITVAVELLKGKRYPEEKIRLALSSKGFSDDEIDEVLRRIL
jgi:hypothetical protein